MLEINRTAPNFELPDLDGNVHRLSDYRDRIVIINFWSQECPQVERTDRVLTTFLPEWGDEVTLLPVASNDNETVEDLRKVSIRRGLPIVLHDAGHVVADLYVAVTTPHVFVVDREGVLRYRGAFDNLTFRQRQVTQTYIKDAVEALVAGKSPDPAQTTPYGCTIVRL